MQGKISQHINRHIEIFQQAVIPMVKDVERCAQLMCQALKQSMYQLDLFI